MTRSEKMFTGRLVNGRAQVDGGGQSRWWWSEWIAVVVYGLGLGNSVRSQLNYSQHVIYFPNREQKEGRPVLGDEQKGGGYRAMEERHTRVCVLSFFQFHFN